MATAPCSAAFDFVLPTPDPVVDAVLQRPVQTFDSHGAFCADAFGLLDLRASRSLVAHREEKLRVHV